MLEPPQSIAGSSDHFAILVGGLVAVLVVTIPALLAMLSTRRKAARTAADVAEVKDEVKNHHKVNFRVEQDERHTVLVRVEQKIDDMLGILGQHAYRLNELEQAREASTSHHPPP